MIWVTGPNGAVVGVSEGLAKSLIGDGSHGYRAVPDPRDKPQPAKAEAPKAPARRPRARKATT